ncbi:MAG TPA: universal stress protein [Pirellulales bacterium]|nr:universal stress protein [Pirellulales bacterium]
MRDPRTPEPTRRAQDFLELVHRGKRGRLKLYLGFAAGVGKTYRMLEEAHALRKRGVDVVVGFVETHGRAETSALLDGLEIVPRRRIPYRGLVVEEMDLDAILARQPEIVIVDELPHTNVPGSRHEKRYQDVLEILEAGIHVIGALNIQHLESLKDIVERTSGVHIRETVPDTFLKQADQIVNLDLAIEDLMDRLRSGKIYAAEKITQALENFFQHQNLSTLRELALREVAESVDRTVVAHNRAGGEHGRSNSERVMVSMASSSPRANALLRRGSRLAGRLNTDWFAVYVETPNESPNLIDSETQRHLHATIQKAKDLGAEVVRLKGRDPVAALLDFARSHNVGHIVIGRSGAPWWKRLVHQSVMHRLVDEADGFDLHIVSLDTEEPTP